MYRAMCPSYVSELCFRAMFPNYVIVKVPSKVLRESLKGELTAFP